MRNRFYRFGKFQLASGTRELRREGGRVALARRAFDCLLYLIEHRDRAVGRDELTAAVWGRVDVTDAQLSQVMLQARRAIDDSGQAQTTIRTLPGSAITGSPRPTRVLTTSARQMRRPPRCRLMALRNRLRVPRRRTPCRRRPLRRRRFRRARRHERRRPGAGLPPRQRSLPCSLPR